MIADSFQYVADILHLLSYVVLIKQIIYNKSVHGSQPLNREISYRTQEMFFLVYIFRYGDIIWNRHSIYLTTMKILYIGLTITIIYLVRFKKPYCLVVANHPGLRPACGQLQPLPLDLPIGFPLDGLCAHLLRSFSIWLEAVALIPQIKVIMNKREVYSGANLGRGDHWTVSGIGWDI
jgi:ER lumen protein retaining receptor